MIRKKTGFWTFIFSIFPGAGEMYLGFFKQGISLMLVFLAACVLSSYSMRFIAILLPVIWFYSFFHVHNLVAMPDEEFYALEDSYFFSSEQDPLLKKASTKNGHRIIGLLCLIIGMCTLWDGIRSLFYRFTEQEFFSAYIGPLFDILPRAVIGLVVIILGIWLIIGKKKELYSNDAGEKQTDKPTMIEQKNE